MLAIFMSAIEGTIIATAMPNIVADLGGFSLFSWVFSGYLLLQAVTIPIYGKLADLFGRKPVILIGTVLFLIGSIACGFAETMTQLIIFRMLQGLGAGAVQPIAMTLVGDIYTLEERGKIQGYLASVWGVSSVIGPALGGLFVQFTHWSWVFWMNIPIGILSMIMLILFLKETVEKKRPSIDYMGSFYLLVTVSSLMLLLIGGGTLWDWSSWPIALLAALFVIGLIIFLYQETRAPEPMMPLTLWKNPVISIANAAGLTTGIILIGLSTFLPTYLQGVMNLSPTAAGFVLASMSISWSISATLAGKKIISFGFRRMILYGGFVLLLGTSFFALMKAEYGPAWPTTGAVIMGIGMGMLYTTFTVVIQNSVPWTQRGVATASHMFTRILGNTLGAALLGGILNARLGPYFANKEAETGLSLELDLANQLLDPDKKAGLSEQVIQIIREGLTLSLHSVYWGIFLIAAFTLLLIFFFPKKTMLTSQSSSLPLENVSK